MRRDKVICMGNAMVDVIAKVDDTFIEDRGLAKGAMILVDADQSAELYDAMPAGTEQSGGSAGNTAAAIASFGGNVGYIGKVFDDQFGKVFRHDIRAVGVQYETAPSTDGPPTATCLVLVTPDAQRTMNTHLGACTSISEADINEDEVKTADILYVEGYLWDTPTMKAAVTKAMDAAIAGGTKVSLSLSDSFCVDRFRAEFRDLVENKVDILFANDAEIMSLYETGSFDDAVAMLKPNVKMAALTRGDKGSLIVTPTETVEIEAQPTQVVDTTGAGDLYAAGVLFGVSAGFDLGVCGQLGSMAAAEIISHIGARPEASLEALAAPLIT